MVIACINSKKLLLLVIPPSPTATKTRHQNH